MDKNENQYLPVRNEITDKHLLSIVLMGGAIAGLSVDVALYPLDTLKTRLQSQYGFRKSGGFTDVYKGIGPLSIGSPISAGIFFWTYEATKTFASPFSSNRLDPFIQMSSAAVGEMACCLAKVPMEIVKQRLQVSSRNQSAVRIVRAAFHDEGLKGMYRGYGSTVLRDVPFSIVQFPIWEWLKKTWKGNVKRDLSAAEVAACGAIAGGIAAAVTTPLDVVKTNIMLSKHGSPEAIDPSVFITTRRIYRSGGFTRLFAGFIPRILLTLIGGAVFFGVFEESCQLLETTFKLRPH